MLLGKCKRNKRYKDNSVILEKFGKGQFGNHSNELAFSSWKN
jgi:hypothetical protein